MLRSRPPRQPHAQALHDARKDAYALFGPRNLQGFAMLMAMAHGKDLRDRKPSKEKLDSQLSEGGQKTLFLQHAQRVHRSLQPRPREGAQTAPQREIPPCSTLALKIP